MNKHRTIQGCTLEIQCSKARAKTGISIFNLGASPEVSCGHAKASSSSRQRNLLQTLLQYCLVHVVAQLYTCTETVMG